jgi:hypothetical protein
MAAELRSLIAPRLVTIVNQAALGAQTADWIRGSDNLSRAKAAFASAGVQYVMIMLGANDAAQGHLESATAYRLNLSSCVNELIGAGFIVLLHDPTYIPAGANGNATTDVSVDLTRRYRFAITQLLNQTTILRGDTAAYDYVREHPETLQSDQTHLTAEGAHALGRFWAESFLQAQQRVPRND